MIATQSDSTDRDHRSGPAASPGAADWLRLAAAPTFALMALLAALPGGAPADLLCSGAPHGSALSGMVPMYGLMAAFHLAPWVTLIMDRYGHSDSE